MRLSSCVKLLFLWLLCHIDSCFEQSFKEVICFFFSRKLRHTYPQCEKIIRSYVFFGGLSSSLAYTLLLTKLLNRVRYDRWHS